MLLQGQEEEGEDDQVRPRRRHLHHLQCGQYRSAVFMLKESLPFEASFALNYTILVQFSLREAFGKKNQNVNFFQKGGGESTPKFTFVLFSFWQLETIIFKPGDTNNSFNAANFEI